MNVREIIQNLQREKKEHTVSTAFNVGYDCGADQAINQLRELEDEIEAMLVGEKKRIEHSRTEQVLLDILGEEETI